MILNKQRYLLRGYCFLSNNMNKEIMEKLGSTDFFSVKKIGSWLEINKKLLGGYNILLKFVFSDNPHANYQRYAHWGVALLVYDNTAVPRGSYSFWLSNTGSQNIADVPLEIYEPLFQSMVTS